MSKNNETYGIPALLSLIIPGLGQIVKGQVGKGVIIMIIEIIVGLVLFFELMFLGETTGDAILGGLIITVISFLIWFPTLIWNVYDAYN